METLQAIMTRRSVRQFADAQISESLLRTLLAAGMAGPSCVNAQDWSFVVVQDKATLNAMADANGAPAQPLRGAAAGILVCGDLSRAFPPAKDYWVIDCAIAAQNITLAAHGQGLGSVWLGTWPQMDRVEAQRKLFALPQHIVPHSILALGVPAAPSRPATMTATCPTVCILKGGRPANPPCPTLRRFRKKLDFCPKKLVK